MKAMLLPLKVHADIKFKLPSFLYPLLYTPCSGKFSPVKKSAFRVALYRGKLSPFRPFYLGSHVGPSLQSLGRFCQRSIAPVYAGDGRIRAFNHRRQFPANYNYIIIYNYIL